MNVIDSVITSLSPEWGLKRQIARVRSKVIEEQVRNYDAAGHSRRTDGWVTTGSSANTEIAKAIFVVRNRMRELVRNDSYARKGVRAITTNVVGKGIRPKISGTDKQSLKVKKALERWMESTECDFEGLLNFYGLEKLVMRCVTESGAAIVLRRRVKNSTGIPIQLQILEPDFIDMARSSSTIDGGYIVNGIEFNKMGKKIAYWLFEKHPGEMYTHNVAVSSRRVAASEVMHIFHVERPGQNTGMPLGVTSALKLRDFNDYEDAQLVRQKIAACFSVFVEDSAEGVMAGSQGAVQLAEKVEPGIIELLPPGKKVSFANPPPAEGYEPYSRTVLRGVAAGFGTTYEQLTGDLSNVNFSSGRMGWIEAHKWYSELQDDVMIGMFCSKAFDWFLEAGAVVQEFSLSSIKCSWIPPVREMIDPVKETEAILSQMRSGIKSYEQVAIENSKDPDELLKEIAKYTELARSLKLELEFDPKFDKGKQKVNSSNPENK